jgi:hypothetical protein
MGTKLTPEENELYKRTDEVLYYIWDPIGVSGEPFARDEYYSYLPKVFKMVLEQYPAKEISAYLLNIEKDYMGLPGNKGRAEEATEILLNYRDKIF